MTDVSVQVPAPVGADQGTTANALDVALGFAPDLRSNPGAAVSVAQAGGDVAGNAQAVAHVQNQNNLQTAANTVAPHVGGHKGLLDSIAGDVRGAAIGLTLGPAEGAYRVASTAVQAVSSGASPLKVAEATGGALVGSSLGLANKPLQQVQHEYRYLKDVGETHGLAAMIPAAVLMAGGAVVGERLGSGQGAVLGAEAGGLVAGQVFYHDSWDRTGKKGYVDPHTGLPVSPGRDIASEVLGHTPGKSKDWLSGALDGMFDIFADPVAKAASFRADTLSEEGAGGWLGHKVGSISVANIDQAVQRPAVMAAMNDIAAKTPGEIVRTYPQLGGEAAARLGAAHTSDDVIQVFKELAATRALLTNALPTETLSQGILRGWKQSIGDALDETKLGTGPFSTALRPVAPEFTENAMIWNNREINLADNNGLQAIYRLVRTALPHNVAQDVVDRYAALPTYELGERALIVKNAIMQMLLARGIPEDHDFVTQLEHEYESMTGGVDVSHSAEFGRDMAGNNLSHAVTDEGAHPSAAIWEGQTSTKMRLPRLANINAAVRDTSTLRSLYGGADDWLFAHWTQGVFKPMALLSAGFGFRVALAEVIPNAFRLGIGDMMQAQLANVVRKMGYTVPEEETPDILAVVNRLVSPFEGDSQFEKYVRNATDLTVANGSHFVPGGVDASNHISAEVNPVEAVTKDLYSAATGNNPRYGYTGQWGLAQPGVGNDFESHADIWQHQLGMIANDPGGQVIAKAYVDALDAGATREGAERTATEAGEQWWNEQDPTYTAKFRRVGATSVPGADPARDFAEIRVRALQGMTHTPVHSDAFLDGQRLVIGGDPHMELLRNIAAGKTPDIDTLNAIPIDERPKLVPMRITKPMVDGSVSRVANWGFRRVIDPIINFVSREPIYLAEYTRQMDTLAGFEESGVLTHGEAMTVAQTRAVVRMTPFIHNTMERSMLSDALRNIAPFYFAQEQSYKRFGRLLATDPGAFRQYQLALTGMNSIGQPTVDNAGTHFVTLPGTGWLGQGMPSLLAKLGISTTFGSPAAFSGNLKSLASVFPFTEDVNPLAKAGPIVTIPAKLVADLFPKTEPAIASIIGTQADQASLWDSFIPNATITRVLATIPPFDQANGFVSTTLQVIQADEARQAAAMDKWVKAGHAATDPGAPEIVPPSTDPQKWNAYIDRVRSQTRILFLLKAAIGTISPLSPSVAVGDLNLKGELHADVTKLGVSVGYAKFAADHPDATAYETGLTSTVGNADVSPTKAFEDFFNANKPLFDKYGSAALWAAPQDPGSYDPAIYSEQMRSGLRRMKSPTEFLTDLYVAEGNKTYYDEALPAYELARANTLGMGQQYLDAQQQLKAGNSQPMAVFNATEALAARSNPVLGELSRQFSQQLLAYGNLHPVWYQAFLDTTGADKVAAEQTINNFRTMFADGAQPSNTQAQGIKILLDGLDNYLAMVNPTQFPNGVVPSAIKEQANLSWQSYLNDVSTSTPGLANVIARVFRRYAG